jgi:hypothetical protein
MAAMKCYALHDILAMHVHGTVDEATHKIIQDLTMQVSSPTYVKTPLFKTEPITTKHRGGDRMGDKKRYSASISTSASASAYKASSEKTMNETEAQLVKIRLLLNKLTDKNFLDIRNSILPILDILFLEKTHHENEGLLEIGTLLFDIASKNRFYSKIYAELCSEFIVKYKPMHDILERNLNQFTELFTTIQYVDSTVDYDAFCENNKRNEKRKSLSSFYFQLMLNGIVPKERLVQITSELLSKVVEYMEKEEKKNVVDELIETIVLMYDKTGQLYKDCPGEIDGGKTIPQFMEWLSACKVKDHPGLTSKTLFKMMDLLGK